MNRRMRGATAFLLAAMWFCVAATIPQYSAAQGYLPGFEDVPVMPGLAGVDGAGLVFDSPSGRIVEAYAVGSVARAKVVRFYGETLASLGWQPLGQQRFAREGEVLSIDTFGPDGELTVRFTLAPAATAPAQ